MLTVILAIPTSAVYAQQVKHGAYNYILIDKVNYGMVKTLTTKFGITSQINLANKEIVLEDKNGVKAILPLDNLHYNVNGSDYVAQVEVKNIEGEFWVPVKDFANVFNLAASYYKEVQRVVEQDKQRSDQTRVTLGEPIYYDETWGNTVPKSIRDYGMSDNITRPIVEATTYQQVKSNPTLEQKTQGK